MVISKKADIKKAIKKIATVQKKNNFDANNFLGKIKKWGKDSIQYQRDLRNEW